jgi:5'-nucleotidase
VTLALLAFARCTPAAHRATVTVHAQARQREVTLTILGTSDLHGHVEHLALFAGYVARVRADRARDGGVVLLDAGDLFQGTLESNTAEGAPVIAAFNALGYTAATIGNHEFDYGPVGDASRPERPGDDPRGALRARIREARFPFVAANLVDAASGRQIAWDNVAPSRIVAVGGVSVGLIGVTSEATPHMTMAVNFAGLGVTPLAPTIAAEATALRARGAAVVVVMAHAGGDCRAFDRPDDLATCEPDAEILSVARALPRGAVDAIVAGHTHAAMAHRVAGNAVVQSYAFGRAFGRVDLTVDPVARRVVRAQIFPPQDVCGEPRASCTHGTYEGAAIAPDPIVAAVVAPAIESARALRSASLGVQIESRVATAYGTESALANLVADLMRAAQPGAEVAITNAGGVRADLMPGELTYGALYEVLPFDNRLVALEMTGAALRRLFAANLTSTGSILAVSGVRAQATCERGVLAVRVTRDDGRALRDDEAVAVVTNDFLASGGEGLFGSEAANARQGPVLRDAVAAQLRSRTAALRGDDPALLDPAHPRMSYPGARPVRCGP